MTGPAIAIGPGDFAALFPFHLACDEHFVVVQVGPSLGKVCPGLAPGTRFADHFRIRRPDVGPDLAAVLRNQDTLFVLEHTGSPLVLRAQVPPVPPQGLVAFLGSPWLQDPTELGKLGLSLTDFAPHDATADLLHLVQASAVALRDTRKLADKLAQQRAQLREANEALRASETRFRNLSEQSPLGVLTSGLDGQVTFVNRRLVSALGGTEACARERLEGALSAGTRGGSPSRYLVPCSGGRARQLRASPAPARRFRRVGEHHREGQRGQRGATDGIHLCHRGHHGEKGGRTGSGTGPRPRARGFRPGPGSAPAWPPPQRIPGIHLRGFQFRELPGLDVAADWLRAHTPRSFRPGILHGDYQFAHVMFRHGAPAKLAAVVDWEMSTVGYPLFDLGWVLMGWPDPDEDRGQALYFDYGGMGSRAELMERYAKRSGLALDAIDYYIVLARFKMACVLEGGYARYVQGGADNPKMAAFGEVVLDMARRAGELARSSKLAAARWPFKYSNQPSAGYGLVLISTARHSRLKSSMTLSVRNLLPA